MDGEVDAHAQSSISLSLKNMNAGSPFALGREDDAGGELETAGALLISVLCLSTDGSYGNRRRDDEINTPALLVSGDLKHDEVAAPLLPPRCWRIDGHRPMSSIHRLKKQGCAW